MATAIFQFKLVRWIIIYESCGPQNWGYSQGHVKAWVKKKLLSLILKYPEIVRTFCSIFFFHFIGKWLRNIQQWNNHKREYLANIRSYMSRARSSREPCHNIIKCCAAISSFCCVINLYTSYMFEQWKRNKTYNGWSISWASDCAGKQIVLLLTLKYSN